MTPTIQLANGRYLDLANPRPESFCADAVATALAKDCRYVGAVQGFYSVAQHCVLIARVFHSVTGPVGQNLRRLALHHEDDEVGTGDVSGPLKLLIGNALAPIARQIKAAAWQHFDIHNEPGLYADVKVVDDLIRHTEKRDLMPINEPEDAIEWGDRQEPYKERILAMEWQHARAMWLAHWAQNSDDNICHGGPICGKHLIQCTPQSLSAYDSIKYIDSWGMERRAIYHRSLICARVLHALDDLPHQRTFK